MIIVPKMTDVVAIKQASRIDITKALLLLSVALSLSDTKYTANSSECNYDRLSVVQTNQIAGAMNDFSKCWCAYANLDANELTR